MLLTLFVFSCSDKTTQPFTHTVATPIFNYESGTYLQGQEYSISCETPEVTIRYTTDGSNPNKNSKVYAEPFTIETSSLVKAVAFKKGWNQSAIASAFYEIYYSGWDEITEITRIIAEPDTIYADNGISYSTISVTVKDFENFAVPGHNVMFKTSLGNIISSATTDDYGIARTTFRAESVTGVATIWAIIRNYHPDHPDLLVSGDTASVCVTIQEAPQVVPTVHSIQFLQTDEIHMNVLNTSFNDHAALRVKLLDENQNLVTTPQNVWFKIVSSNPPLGVNLNNQPVSDSVMTVSENGYAQVYVYSGTVPGNLAVRASCTTTTDYITAIKTDIVIHVGPPHTINIFSSGYNTGINVGAGLWRIIVGAQMSDIYGNPSEYGTSVWFSLPDDNNNCLINSAAYVGNESVTGDSTAGVAYTTLTYSGIYTFERLKIRATTGGVNGMEVIGETYIVLPLNQPQLEFEIIPGNLVFHGNTNTIPPSAAATINASVFDVQGCPIHNARISLTASAGEFESIYGTNRDPLNCNPYSSPNIIVTDWYDQYAIYEWYYDPFWQIPGGPDIIDDGQDGLAKGQIRFYEWEIPLGDPMTGKSDLLTRCPGILVVTITGRLINTNIKASSTIILIRYPT